VLDSESLSLHKYISFTLHSTLPRQQSSPETNRLVHPVTKSGAIGSCTGYHPSPIAPPAPISGAGSGVSGYLDYAGGG